MLELRPELRKLNGFTFETVRVQVTTCIFTTPDQMACSVKSKLFKLKSSCFMRQGKKKKKKRNQGCMLEMDDVLARWHGRPLTGLGGIHVCRQDNKSKPNLLTDLALLRPGDDDHDQAPWIYSPLARPAHLPSAYGGTLPASRSRSDGRGRADLRRCAVGTASDRAAGLATPRNPVGIIRHVCSRSTTKCPRAMTWDSCSRGDARP